MTVSEGKLVAFALLALLTACAATDAPPEESATVGGGAGAPPEELTPDPPPASGGGWGGGAGATSVGGSAGSAGTTGATCGDGVCDAVSESCATCAADCACGSGGAGGSASGGAGGASGGAGGTGAATATGGSAGASSPGDLAMIRAESGVGFSYWWGHGRFLVEGPSASNKGSCSGSCPDCTHTGSYGGDCSGYVAKIWQVPSSNSDLTKDSHPYTTASFNEDTTQWSTIAQGSMKAGDAMVYRSGGAGHIFLYHHGDPWGSMYAYECKGCSAGCTKGLRTASSAYHAIRKTGY
ncbi:MAG: hypothetical protein U0263_33975 [Polyangiaceae bacterium]